VTVRRAATSAMALASAGWPVRVRTQIIHSDAARPTTPIGRVWQSGGYWPSSVLDDDHGS
jgi:hypothetical protein